VTTETATPKTAAIGATPAAAATANGQLLPLLLILLAGALVRVGLWTWFQDLPIRIHDERDYNALAINLVEHGEYAYILGVPASLRPPLYPALVAGVYAAFGVENLQAVRKVQIVLSLATALVLYGLGRRLYSRRVGLWLCAFYCFYPSLLGFNNLVLTEVLFTFLLSAACYTLVICFQQDSVRWLWLAGLLVGLGALTRSALWLFPPVVCAFLLLALKASLRQRLLGIGSFCLAFGVVIAPWAVRTSRLEKTFIPIDTMGGRNFMMGNYEHTPLYRAWDAISLQGEKSWFHVLTEAYPHVRETTQGQRDKLALQLGLKFVREHPGLTLQRDVVKFFNFWGLERELIAGAAVGFFGPVPKPVLLGLTLLIFGSYAFAMIGGIFGAVLVPPADRRAHWFLIATVAFLCLLHTAVFAHSRYHLPVMPLVLAYAAAAWVYAREIRPRQSRWGFGLAAGLSAVLVTAWLYEIVIVDLERFMNLMRSVA
jgi:4-amino-4-deoxy-L-arabinose transferase-like glycosyltransferase